MNITDSLLYTDDHEWIKIEDSQAIIGITDFAQSELCWGRNSRVFGG